MIVKESLLSVEFIYCECNCGFTRPKYDKKGRECRFIYKHAVLKGEKSPWYNGGEYLDKKGYVRVYKPEHPKAYSNGTMAKHRLVWEEHYKVCLLDWIDIHHKNGIKNDNRIENLEVLDHKEHSRLSGYRDFSNRKCIECKTTKTKIKGHPIWIRHPITKQKWVCNKCYDRIYHKIYHSKSRHHFPN